MKIRLTKNAKIRCLGYMKLTFLQTQDIPGATGNTLVTNQSEIITKCTYKILRNVISISRSQIN